MTKKVRIHGKQVVPHVLTPGNSAVSMPSEAKLLREKTLNLARRLVGEYGKEHGADDDWQTKARYWTEVIVLNQHSGTVRVPQEIKDLVHQMVKQACAETGYQLPPRPRPKRKKKRR